MNDRFDDLLKDALTPSEEPSAILTQKILQKAKGEKEMRKPFFKTVPVVAAIAIAFLATGSLTAYAAWQYLSTEQVAEELEDRKLAQAFQKEGAVRINESQTYGNYKITLLGAVSGKNLSDYTEEEDCGEIEDDKTYAVIAIARKDGSAMPDMDDEDYSLTSFMVSPFIKGEDPVSLNIYHMGGGAQGFVQDGIDYRIVECDNLEVFAERGVYLGVIDDIFYDNKAYDFDKESGEITRNEKYKGVNALFDLPLEKAEADEEAAEKQLADWQAEFEGNDETENKEESVKEDKWTVEKIKKECTLLEETMKTYPASKFDTMVPCNYKTKAGENEGDFRPSCFYQKNQYGEVYVGGTDSEGEGKRERTFIICNRHEDGTFTVSMYVK